MLLTIKEYFLCKSNWIIIVLVSGATGALLISNPVMAAPLTYSSATTITLTSSGVNFTVASGSVADSLTINPTNVVVILSTSTGGTFTLTSPSANLSVSQAGSGGSAPVTCVGTAGTNGTASVTLTQSSASTSYTISPASSQCSVPGTAVSAPTGGGGGGGGTGIVMYPLSTSTPPVSTSTPIVTPTVSASTSTPTTDQLLAQLATLKATLLTLITQAQQLGIPLPPGVMQVLQPTSQKFTRNLIFGSSGDDVTALQNFLISQPSSEWPSGRVATGYFGKITKAALSKYQAAVGISPPSGYFGPKTRAYINSLGQ